MVFFTCKDKDKLTHVTIKDSLLNQYMTIAHDNPYFDNPEESASFLDAYYRNDTISLKQIYISKLDAVKKYKGGKNCDSCFHLLDLKGLNVDEAYRFMYSQAFCDNSLCLTISKKDGLIKLHCISFPSLDTVIRNNSSAFEKTLSINDWTDFKNSIDHSDFWALKRENGKSGLDGNDITVLGFIKSNESPGEKDKFHGVYRFWAEGTDLITPFKKILTLSGKNLGCP